MMNESSNPIKIKRITDSSGHGEGIEVVWSTGETTAFGSRMLRKSCPCASCGQLRGDTSHDKPLGGGRSTLRVLKSSIEEEIDLVSLWAVGNYAIGIRWGDRHDSGIYSYTLLRELANQILGNAEESHATSCIHRPRPSC